MVGSRSDEGLGVLGVWGTGVQECWEYRVVRLSGYWGSRGDVGGQGISGGPGVVGSRVGRGTGVVGSRVVESRGDGGLGVVRVQGW